MAIQADISKVQELLETQLSTLCTAATYVYAAPFKSFDEADAVSPCVRSISIEVTPSPRRSSGEQWISTFKWTISCELQGTQGTSGYKIHEVASTIAAGLSEYSAIDSGTSHIVHIHDVGANIPLLGVDTEGTETIQQATITAMGEAYRTAGDTIASR